MERLIEEIREAEKAAPMLIEGAKREAENRINAAKDKIKAKRQAEEDRIRAEGMQRLKGTEKRLERIQADILEKGKHAAAELTKKAKINDAVNFIIKKFEEELKC